MNMKKGSKKTIKTKPNPEYKLIEERVEADTSDREKHNKFFTARNIALIIVFFTASVALLVVTVFIVLHIDFKGLADAIAYGFTVENSYVWFLLLILYFVYSIFTNFGTIWVRLRKWGYHIPFWEYWLYGAVTSFLKAVTPVLFSDPYTFFWLRTKGVPASRATSLLFTNTLWWQFIQFAVTLPSFIIVLCHREALLSSNEGIFAFIFLCSGMTIDVISIAFMIFLNMSKSMHSIISRVYNWIKKKFHMKYHTKEQIELKYKQRAALKEDFIKSTKDWKTTILIVLIFALNEIVLYFAINWSLYFVQNGHYGNIEYTAYFNFWDAFNCGNITFTASRISSIVPGNNGPLEKLLNIFLVNLASFNVCIAVTHDPVPLPEDTYNIIQVVSNNGIIIWRIFGTYLPAVTGLGCLISLSIIQYRRHKAKQANIVNNMNKMNKNITIIGCGISSATLANILANKGWNVTIYEKTNHVGGNCFDSFDSNGILIHNFGPHIFHTSYEDVYTFVSQFTKFNNYVNKVLVSVDNKLFPLPINFKSIEEIMGSKSAKKIICQLQQLFPNKETATLFDLRMIDNVEIKQFVDWISQNVYFNYSAKMWGTKFENIDPNTISRVKIILGYNHNYFPNDKYQGLPTEGYTKMIEAMLRHPNIKVNLNVDALKHIKFDNEIKWDDKKLNGPVVYCGPLDEALDYKYGILPYRSLNIQFETHNVTDFQKTAVVNYPADPTMTRIAEYKKMTLQNKKGITTISKEFPGQFKLNDVVFGHRYYPIINETNLSLYNKYLNFFKQYKNFYPLGRLSQYKYYDMDDVIKQAIDLAKELINA